MKDFKCFKILYFKNSCFTRKFQEAFSKKSLLFICFPRKYNIANFIQSTDLTFYMLKSTNLTFVTRL